MNPLETVAVFSAATTLSFGGALLLQWSALRVMFHLLPRPATRRLATAAPVHTRRMVIPRIPAAPLHRGAAG